MFKEFNFKMISYMDTAKKFTVCGKQFYILDKVSNSAGLSKTHTTSGSLIRKAKRLSKKARLQDIDDDSQQPKQAIVGPVKSPMIVNTKDIIYQPCSTSNEPDQFTFRLTKLPNYDKYNEIEINGLKIFVKLQLFILLKAFFMNAFPVYHESSKDKPAGFNADPERSNLNAVNLKILNSLICLLNRPNYKSIACQGDIEIELSQENIKLKKEKIQNLNAQLVRERRTRRASTRNPSALTNVPDDYESTQGGDSSEYDDDYANEDAIDQVSRVYLTKINVTNFTPFICSISHLDGQSFQNIKKR